MWPWRVTITEHSEGQPGWIWIWVASRHLNSTGLKKSQRNKFCLEIKIMQIGLDWIAGLLCWHCILPVTIFFNNTTQVGTMTEASGRIMSPCVLQSQQTVCQLRSGVAGSWNDSQAEEWLRSLRVVTRWLISLPQTGSVVCSQDFLHRYVRPPVHWRAVSSLPPLLPAADGVRLFPAAVPRGRLRRHARERVDGGVHGEGDAAAGGRAVRVCLRHRRPVQPAGRGRLQEIRGHGSQPLLHQQPTEVSSGQIN